MRTLLAGELTLALSGDTNVDLYVKLEVQNGSGTWIDVGAAGGKNWIINATWGEVIDTVVGAATFAIVQAIGALSMAPLISASVLNRLDDGVTYSPLLDVGRLVRASSATMAKGVALDVTKYRQIFTGRIDNVGEQDSLDWLGPVTITCSDMGGWLMDRQIETDGLQYGTSPVGTALETVLQNVINATLPGGEPAVTLVKQSASNFAVTNWIQGATKVMEGLQTLVLNTVGEDIRYRYDAAHVSQLMWFNPDRTRVTVDATIPKDQYILQKLDLSLANIRNAGRMPWNDPVLVTSGFVTSTAAPSVARYRRRFFNLPASPMLVTQAQSQTVLDAVVNDLSVPPGEAAAICPYLWFVQLYDRYTFAANGRQYDQNQTFAIIGYQHSIQNGIGSTTLTVAGKIVGAYASWLKKIVVSTKGAAPQPKITLITQDLYTMVLQFDATLDPAQAPASWRVRILGDSDFSSAWTSPVIGALPAQVTFNRGNFRQSSIELEVTQQDGQIATTSFPIQGQIKGHIDSGDGRTDEDDHRTGDGGLPINRGRVKVLDQYSSDGTTPLVDTTLGRFTSNMSGPTGISGTVIERGGNKGDAALNGSFNLQTGVDPAAVGVDGYGNIESRRGTAKAAGHAARGRLGEDEDRSGTGGVPTPSGRIHPDVIYSDDGTTPLIDTVARRFQTALSGPTGVGGDVIERGGNKGDGAFTNTTGSMVSTAKESGGKNMNRLYAKALSSDADTVDSVADGSSYAKILSNRLTSGALKRTGAYDDGDYAIRSQTNDGRTVMATVSDSGGRTVLKFLAKGLTTDPDTLDSTADGSTYKKIGSVVSNKITNGSSTPRFRCKASMAGNQSIPNASGGTKINWDSHVYDVGALHSDSVTNTRITIPTGGDVGAWCFVVSVIWGANATGQRFVHILKNGSAEVGGVFVLPAGGGNPTFTQVIAFDDAPSVGDYYEVEVVQDSGGALNVNAGLATFFQAVHLW